MARWRCWATRRASWNFDGHPKGVRIHNPMGDTRAFSPDYHPEEMFEIASKLYKKSR